MLKGCITFFTSFIAVFMYLTLNMSNEFGTVQEQTSLTLINTFYQMFAFALHTQRFKCNFMTVIYDIQQLRNFTTTRGFHKRSL